MDADRTVGEGNQTRTVEVPLQTSMASVSFDVIAPGTCMQVDSYDLFFDGDFLTAYQIAYTDTDGAPRQGRVVIDKGGPRRRWLTLAER